ncbi:MAG: hypothetical protein P4L85_26180 [Paludisphaera borealis]|uniref:hypothetical protein n=1 Tax=Paludisphaera borealis TaxID=1387353 RepID=UPI002840DCF1|nr:hypothetical protein [Paludisphaera borealis]MDR3622869.1 hypothetical protein [Paludisphaera borealis]
MHRFHFLASSIALVALLVTAAGCGGAGASASAPSHDDALQHVRSALDAWKGGKVKDLATAQPSIRFVDPDQAAGAKLDDYKIGDAPATVAHVVDVPVELTITDKKRKTRTLSTVFQVVAAPGVSVMRNDP